MFSRSAQTITLGVVASLGFVTFGCETRDVPGLHAESEALDDDAHAALLPYYDNAQFDPRWHASDSPALESFHSIPGFTLTNQDGQEVTERTFEGKIYVADFFFTACPSVCPKMTEAMAALQETFIDDEDVLFLSHSVTPQADSPEVLKAYAERRGVVSGKWHLVTGDRSTIYGLGRQSYFVEEDLGEEKADDEFLHTDNFVLIDKRRHIRGI